MLLKGKAGTYPKDLLKAIISLKDNPDFEEIMAFMATNKTHCSQQSCLHPDDGISKKLSGGFIAFLEFEQLVETAEDKLEKSKSKEKR